LSKIVKYSLAGFGLVIAIIVLLGVLASVFIDPSAYRQQLVQIVKSQTGRDLKISGDVSLSLFPWLGVQFGEMQLNAPSGFVPEVFASLKQANIKVAVLPLIMGRVDIDHIVIDGLSLNLVRTQQGDANWIFASTAKPSETKPGKDNSGKESSSGLAAIRLGSLTLKDSNISWNDKQAVSSVVVSHLGLTLDRLASGEQTDLSLVAGVALEKFKTIPVKITSKIMIDWPQHLAQMIRSKIELGEVAFETQFTARFPDGLNVEGSASMEKMAPLSALKLFNVDYKPANNKMMKSLQAGLNFNYLDDGKSNNLNLKNITISLDQSRITGNAALQLDGKKPHEFDLAIKNFNTDDYMPVSATNVTANTGNPAKPAKKQKTDDPISLPDTLLRTLNISGQLKLENIRATGIGFNTIDTRVVAKGGVVTLNPFHARLYEGQTKGKFQLDVHGKTPVYLAAQKLTGIQIGDLIKDMDIFDKFSGKGSLAFDITTSGDRVSLLKKNLKGTLSTKLGKGKLVGADFIRQLREARDAYEALQGKQKKPGDKVTGNETVYDSLTATATITKGVINNPDLLVTGPKLQITGIGQTDLPRNWIYYKLNALYQEKVGVEPIKAPIKVKGPIDNPVIKVEYQKILRKEGEKRIRKEAEKALEKELRKGLDRLFQR